MPVKEIEAPALDIAAGQDLPPALVKEPRYLVRTVNGEYTGKTLGVKFDRGRAVVDKNTIDERLGRTVEEIAWFFKNDFHYEVTEY